MPTPNWTPKAAANKTNHSVHVLNLVTPGKVPTKMLEEIKFRLAWFVDFDGGSNSVADVAIKWHKQIRYAWFTMRSLPGIPSRLLNGNPVPVQTWCDPAGMVTGDTADRHMLIGQRRWWVQQISDNALMVATEAYEWPRGKINWLGMRWIGKNAQVALWHAYLSNMNVELTTRFGSTGTVTIAAAQVVPGNPWRPTQAYPHLGGCK
jgi:hypothetical protein